MAFFILERMVYIFNYKGKRIRASDENLVYYSAFGFFGIIVLVVMLLFHQRSIRLMDWSSIVLKDAFNGILYQLQSGYFWGSLITALFVSLLLGFLVYRYKIDTIKQLTHRQSLARMVLQNGWYETSNVQSESFFKDLHSSSNKERISYFPKMYYYLKDGLIHINVKITMGRHQDQLLHLESKLETGLYCELVDKILEENYVEYILLYDTIASRITIDDVGVEDGSLKLMENVYWDYDSLPHMLIAGGTGGGKTYFILTIIEALLKTNANLYILDPKNADLADLETIMGNVYYRQADMLDCIQRFHDDMVLRSEEMKNHPNYKTGENYAYLGLPANFLIFDEYVAFMDMLGRESAEVISTLKRIVMLGRQAGFFLILACQRPDAKYLGDGIRDQFNFRVALGRMSELGFGMMFGSDVQKQFFLKPIKGRGYVDVGTSVISEFYTPLVPKGHDFLKQIEGIVSEKEKIKESCIEI